MNPRPDPDALTFPELFRTDVQIERDIPYAGVNDDPRRSLDLYRMEGAENASVVIYFYGGGWRSGDKRLFEHLGRAFAIRGYVAVIVNYRHTPARRYGSPAGYTGVGCSSRWPS